MLGGAAADGGACDMPSVKQPCTIIRTDAARTPLHTEKIRTVFDVLPPYLIKALFFPGDGAPAPRERSTAPEGSGQRGDGQTPYQSNTLGPEHTVRLPGLLCTHAHEILTCRLQAECHRHLRSASGRTAKHTRSPWRRGLPQRCPRRRRLDVVQHHRSANPRRRG